MKFEPVFIKVPCQPVAKKGSTPKIDDTAFWKEAEKESEGISGAKGCYIFGLSRGGGAPKPWYIGKATKFKGEVFSHRNIGIYRECMDDTIKGAPVIILLPIKTEKGDFARAANLDGAIDWVETYLIHAGVKRNPKLKNLQKTGLLKRVIIPGLLGAGQGSSNHGRALKEMFRGQPKRRHAKA
jgi:hypothetical protein